MSEAFIVLMAVVIVNLPVLIVLGKVVDTLEQLEYGVSVIAVVLKDLFKETTGKSYMSYKLGKIDNDNE